MNFVSRISHLVSRMSSPRRPRAGQPLAERRRGFSILFLIPCFLLLISCGDASMTGEDYGDLTASPSSLRLTEDEHEQGWGRSNCWICHNEFNIHFDDSPTGFDMAAVRARVERDGLACCSVCHGDNGVE